MGFEWVGEVRVSRVPEIAKEVDGTATLVGGLCTNCGTAAFPMSEACIACGSAEVRSVALPKIGQLYSWTRVHVSNSRSVPYWLGYVDFPGDTRILGELRLGHAAAHPGLELSAQADGSGRWWFEPAGIAA